MKLLIVGSRSVGAFDLSPYVAEDVDMIISGGANGIDRLAEEYADTHRLSKLILRPAYARYGKAAPLKRNEEMVDMADRILVIWDGRFKGTAYTVKYAQKNGEAGTADPNVRKQSDGSSMALFCWKKLDSTPTIFPKPLYETPKM